MTSSTIQTVLGGALVNFPNTANPATQNVAQGAGGLTVANAGDYAYTFQVVGNPVNKLTPPSSLVFGLSIGGAVQTATLAQSDVQQTTLAAGGTESVNGSRIVRLSAGAVVGLFNQTESGASSAGTVDLLALPPGTSQTASINASLSLVRVA